MEGNQSVVDREALGRVREIQGVETADLDIRATDTYFMEVMAPDGEDGVFHVFALDESGPEDWAPPKGTQRIQSALQKMKDVVKLQTKEKWAEIQWEPDGLPELFHQAVRKMESDTSAWLLKAGVGPEIVDGPELLNRLQKRLFDPKWSWYRQRMALAARLRLTPLAELLRGLGDSLPDVESPKYEYMNLLFPVKPGSWFVRIFGLPRLVMDQGMVADTLLGSIDL